MWLETENVSDLRFPDSVYEMHIKYEHFIEFLLQYLYRSSVVSTVVSQEVDPAPSLLLRLAWFSCV